MKFFKMLVVILAFVFMASISHASLIRQTDDGPGHDPGPAKYTTTTISLDSGADGDGHGP